MRTPPPVLREPDEGDSVYVPTFMDRRGAHGANDIKRAAGVAFVFMAGFGLYMFGYASFGLKVPGGAFTAVLIGIAVGAIPAYAVWAMPSAAGDAALAFVQPSGKSTPYEQSFSYQEAMMMKGDVDGAMESYEAIISASPNAVAPRMKAAEHYVYKNRNPKRAADLFREIRNSPDATSRDLLYASSRLIDLYDGVLDDPGRALVELKRLVDQFPTSPQAVHGRAALPALKERVQALNTRSS